MKLNCWEFMGCAWGPPAEGEPRDDVCPAALEYRLNGVHGGINAGRACWVVTDTICEGRAQGAFAQKAACCADCDFYRTVQDEEFPHFVLTPNLLGMLDAQAERPS